MNRAPADHYHARPYHRRGSRLQFEADEEARRRSRMLGLAIALLLVVTVSGAAYAILRWWL